MTINGGGKGPLLQLYPKEFLPFLGLVGKGSFNPSQYGRSLASLEMTGYENHFCLLGKGGDPSQKTFGTTLRVG